MSFPSFWHTFINGDFRKFFLKLYVVQFKIVELLSALFNSNYK